MSVADPISKGTMHITLALKTCPCEWRGTPGPACSTHPHGIQRLPQILLLRGVLRVFYQLLHQEHQEDLSPILGHAPP